jgi:hypothetical protein
MSLLDEEMREGPFSCLSRIVENSIILVIIIIITIIIIIIIIIITPDQELTRCGCLPQESFPRDGCDVDTFISLLFRELCKSNTKLR